MLISVEKNFIFVHVAKTGGQALKAMLKPYAVPKAQGQWRRLLSHLPVREGFDAQFGPHASARWAKLKLPPDFFDDAFKFALVRITQIFSHADEGNSVECVRIKLDRK
jgi:hypothetical protein